MAGWLLAGPEEEQVRRIFATAAFAAVFGLVLVALAAQRSAATETPPQIGHAAAANVIEPGEIRASKLLGSAVHNAIKGTLALHHGHRTSVARKPVGVARVLRRCHR